MAAQTEVFIKLFLMYFNTIILSKPTLKMFDIYV